LLARRRARKLALIALCAVLAAPVAARARGGQRAENPHAAKIQAFKERLKQYVDLKKKLEAGLPKAAPSDRTTKVEVRQDELAERVRRARKGARQGDLVGDAAAIITATIARDARNRSVRDAYAAMQEVPSANPPAVNAEYPEKAALATVPPLILVNLPQLPDSLEYRFMGRDLILRDRECNLIVDFVPGAVPAFKK
jgi:hypothetical protein